jgi:hypothetical protein
MQVVCRNFGATDGYTEQNQNGDVIGQYVANGTNDRSTLTQTGDRNTNTSNLPEIIIYRRHWQNIDITWTEQFGNDNVSDVYQGGDLNNATISQGRSLELTLINILMAI